MVVFINYGSFYKLSILYFVSINKILKYSYIKKGKEKETFMTPPTPHDPISRLHQSLGKEIILKVKRNRKFKGILKSFDTHLNVLLEKVEYSYFEKIDEEGTLEEKNESLPTIILRGDSIIFIGLAD